MVCLVFLFGRKFSYLLLLSSLRSMASSLAWQRVSRPSLGAAAVVFVTPQSLAPQGHMMKRSLSSFLNTQRKIQAIMEGAISRSQQSTHTASMPDPPESPPCTPIHFLAEGLTRTAIHRMRVADLRTELQRRKQDTSGTKKDLIPRLLDCIDTSGNDKPGTHAPHSLLDQQVLLDAAADTTTPSLSEPCDPVDPNRRYILQVKGLSSLSSNGTGVGFVLFDAQDPSICWEARKYLQGNRSVFESEYSALVLAMRYALRRGVANVVLQLDHDVIQQQIRGTYSVEKESLKGIYWKFMSYREGVSSFSTELITSLDNHRAADLAIKALATGKSLNVCDSHDPMENMIRKKSQNAGSPLENEDDMTQSIDPFMTYRLQFDGGARSNPKGVAGAGMVLYDDQDKEIWCGWCYLDKMSNNAAEYWALLLGLKCALSLGIRKIRCQGDSELIIKQVTGKYRVKDANLRKLYEPTINVAEQFDDISFEHIYRTANERADWLANHAMDTQTNHGFEEI